MGRGRPGVRRGLERVKVAVSVVGEEGPTPVGADETLDDGAAAVTFPEKMLGDADGRLRVVASVQAPEPGRRAWSRSARTLRARPLDPGACTWRTT